MELTLKKIEEKWGGIFPYLETLGINKHRREQIKNNLLIPERSSL